ncbi:MAG: glycosyltransferase WbuB [Calditrichaeota bacterium]|nr:MAG: glycosyltransferase WbuB [Calditrichota bacterium]
MHILLIHQAFVTPSEGGGTRHFEMCRYLVHMGHRVTVITGEVNYLTGEKRNVSEEVMEGIQIYYIKVYRSIHRSIFHRALSFLSFAANSFFKGLRVDKVDLVWGTSPPLFQGIIGLWISKLRRLPYVFEVRDLWLDFARELGVVTNSFVYYSFKFLEKMIYKGATAIITNSPGFVPHIKKVVPQKEVHIFPNGVDMMDFAKLDKQKSLEFRARFGLENKFVVLYAGNIGIANDIETILEAARLLRKKAPDIIFVLMGGGLKIEEYRAKCQEEWLSNVKFLPAQPKKVMPQIIFSADVCLATLKDIPLFNTTYPNKVFDYMAASRPIVLAIDGAIREVVEKAKCGIPVPPGDPSKLAEAVWGYYNQPSLIELHGKSGREYVGKHFNREKISREFSDFLFSLAEQDNRG